MNCCRVAQGVYREPCRLWGLWPHFYLADGPLDSRAGGFLSIIAYCRVRIRVAGSMSQAWHARDVLQSLQWFAQKTAPGRLEKWVTAASNKQSLPRKTYVITFDDGRRGNFMSMHFTSCAKPKRQPLLFLPRI